MKYWLVITLLFAGVISFAQNLTLSDQAEISVITCGPSRAQVYTAFGHSAFRVHDPQNGIDVVYNYGIFDFDQPNFHLNFARGRNKYMLGIQDYQRFREVYIYHNRFLHEQQLNLNPSQKQRVFDYLVWNSQPENQYYYYDYFYDNCATRIRDVMTTVLKDSVKFDGSYITTDYTIRQLTDLYLEAQPWGDLGIDVGLGLPMDKKATPYMHMFLPDYIASGFDHATINRNGAMVPLVKTTNSIYESRPVGEVRRGISHPLFVFLAFAVVAIGLSLYDFRRKKLSNWFDAILFGTTGFLGIVLFLLWVATDHRAAAQNFNLLWALPFNFAAVFVLSRNPEWLEKYFFGVAVLSALLLVTWYWLPQQLNHFLIPLVIAIMSRAFIQYRLRKDRSKNL